ncbi:hypothetical protein [Legionella sp. km772]|uniref:hypothetical protein n=1 Tax=Legionella sp. km772 TaxID=2498111 RepID=UPI000F8D7BE6|nr:hypothetical protein [Legionella sp. km772]RUR12742.1 hypothetical protein ELY15_04115 [Legionella sp. km772]
MPAIFQSEKSYLLQLFLLYFISNVFLLLNFNGVYWDDWSLAYQSPEIIKNIFAQNSFIWIGYLHIFLKNIGNGIYIYRILVFFTYFGSGICLFYILQRIKYIDKNSAFFITLFFLLAPVNNARIALINTPPILMLGIFYFSFLLLTQYLDNKRTIIYRIIILSLFFISFLLESLLVFYSIVLLYIFYHLIEKNTGKLFINFIVHYFDFIILPIVFFVLKHSLFKPYGSYVNYNALSPDYLKTVELTYESFDTSLYAPISQALMTAGSNLYLTILLFVIILLVFRPRNTQRVIKNNFKNSSVMIFLLLSLIFFVVAVFPYCAVGKLPVLGNWSSRNQILVPLGMAFLIYFLIVIIAKLNKKIASILMGGLLAVFMMEDLFSYYRYQIDWFYQCSLMQQFQASEVVKNYQTFVVEDTLEKRVWVNSGTLSINWILKNALHENTRLMVRNNQSLEVFKQTKMYPEHFAADWTYTPPVYLKLLINKNYPLNLKNITKLFIYNKFNPKKFEPTVKNLTEIKVVSTPSADNLL